MTPEEFDKHFDEYFKNISVEQLISKLKNLGVKFDSDNKDIPTPLTDANERDDWTPGVSCVSSEFARDLERKLIKAQKECLYKFLALLDVCEEREELKKILENH